MRWSEKRVAISSVARALATPEEPPRGVLRPVCPSSAACAKKSARAPYNTRRPCPPLAFDSRAPPSIHGHGTPHPPLTPRPTLVPPRAQPSDGLDRTSAVASHPRWTRPETSAQPRFPTRYAAPLFREVPADRRDRARADVEVPEDDIPTQRRRDYPPPPSGHDLMALFPPPPPTSLAELRPTSGYFNAQERAYFSRPGNEIIRWEGRRDGRASPRERERGKGKHRTSPSRMQPHPPTPATVYIPPSAHGPPPRSPPTHAAGGPGAPPAGYAFPPSAAPQPQASSSRGHSSSGQITTINIPPAHTPVGGRPPSYYAHAPPPPGSGGPYAPLHPQAHPGPMHSPPYSHAAPPGHGHGHAPGPPQPPRHLHGHAHGPAHPYDGAHAGGPGVAGRRSRSPKEEYDPADPDQHWRRPMPPAERRRAGKHTKRVIVK